MDYKMNDTSVRIWQDSTSYGRGWTWAVYKDNIQVRQGWTNVSFEKAAEMAEIHRDRVNQEKGSEH